MGIALDSSTIAMDIRALHERMGRVYHQPVRVHSFTNKRFTVNFRVPLEQLRRIVPDPIELDEISDTGLGMLSMCACDFWVGRLGLLPIPPVRNNDMLCRVSTKVRKAGSGLPRLLHAPVGLVVAVPGILRSRFSHFRKQVSPIRARRRRGPYSLECRPPTRSAGASSRRSWRRSPRRGPPRPSSPTWTQAKQFVFDLDGSCGYSYERGMLSFQKIDYPPWDMYFCHEYRYDFPLMDYVYATFGLEAEFDCVLFMRDTDRPGARPGCTGTEVPAQSHAPPALAAGSQQRVLTDPMG